MARKLGPQKYHGLLLIDKPKDMVSKDVSRQLERQLGRLKIGHVGTLDPLATGLLPILLGKATRLQDYLLDLAKGYRFEVTFGEATETLDSTGEVVKSMAADHITAEDISKVCLELCGPFIQIPPIYSAIKFQGKPLYWYARQGRADEIDLESFKKSVYLHSLDFLGFEDNKAQFSVRCSKGTYVRTLAATIAEKLNCCGYISALQRTQAAGYGLDQAYRLEDIEQQLDSFENCLIDVENIDLQLPKWVITDPGLSKRLKMGQKMQVDRHYFEKNLRLGDPQMVTGDVCQNILLLDGHNKSIGIGNAIAQGSGRMAIQMRKGLS